LKQQLRKHNLWQLHASTNPPPPQYKNQSYYSINNAINYTHETIPLQVWADAISAATVRGLAATSAVSAESVLGGLLQTGYMAIGGSILKITPIAHVGSSKAMAAIKLQATAQAKVEADQIRAAATTYAAEHRANADQAAQSILAIANQTKQQADRELAAARNEGRIKPPQWLLANQYGEGVNIPFRRDADGRWQVGIVLTITPTIFEYQGSYLDEQQEQQVAQMGRLEWRALRSQKPPIKVFIWQPIENAEGTYNPRHAIIDATISPVSSMPHMHTGGSCLGLADGPPLLNSAAALSSLRNSLQRVHSGINLASLLQQPEQWKATFKPWIPEELMTLINDRDRGWQAAMNEQLRLRAIPAERGEGVWTA
jgi:hypothetical protein